MKAKSIILIIVAGGCGLVAAIGVSQVIGQSGGEENANVAMQKILVASNDLNIGDPLNEKNVKLEAWPKDRVPEGAITDIDRLKDETTNTRMYRGEPILEKKLIAPGEVDTPIPPGYRVAVMKVDNRTIPPRVLPGDRVDIAVVFRRGGEIQFTGTRTVLKKVRVYGVNTQVERIVEDGQPIDAKTISVLVTPKQFEMLMLVTELGKVRIAQRRVSDDSDDDADEFDISELYSTGPQDADVPQEAQTPEASIARALPILDDEPEVEPKFKMVIRTPGGERTFVWHDENDRPIEQTDQLSAAATTLNSLDLPGLNDGPARSSGERNATPPSDDATKKSGSDGKSDKVRLLN